MDYCLIGTWFNSISDLTTMMPKSQNFTSLYNVNFSWFNNTWFNSQTWFTGVIFRFHGKFWPNLKALVQNFIQSIIVLFILCLFTSFKPNFSSIIFNLAKNRFIKKNYSMNLIYSCIDAFKLGRIFQWDQKIVPVKQAWVLNQVLLNQEKKML